MNWRSVCSRISLITLVAALLLILAPTPSPGQVAPTWSCGLNALAATLTECQAAPGAGLRLYLTDLVVQTTTAVSGTYAVQYGTGTNCVTGTTALLPVSGTANSFNAPITSEGADFVNFKTPIRAGVNTAICVIGTLTNTISIQLSGYIGP